VEKLAILPNKLSPQQCSSRPVRDFFCLFGNLFNPLKIRELKIISHFIVFAFWQPFFSSKFAAPIFFPSLKVK
jgi:hypothetical protein